MSTSQATNDIQGEISIHTENILPIIKKWLYSEHEIFVRELVSNAFDAIKKRQKIAVVDSIEAPVGRIELKIDEAAKTITISDNGLGMDSEEIQKYINQIAFSGAEDFVTKYQGKDKDDSSQIIGHFGLGFYSSFMVSDIVEITSLSYKQDAVAINWSCDGSTKFYLKETVKDTVGTDIVLHISEENGEYLHEARLTELVKRYANFLPVEILVNGKTVNDQNPLWIKQPNEVTDEEYLDFYQKLFPFSPPPLFWIHLNVDYPFNLKGILYFPKLLHELDSHKGQVKLFCQQVFVTENAKDIIPEFMTLLQGAVDCPDIPLNVSRSYLQNDPYVQKISKHIVKKIADKLNELYKKDKASYEKYWEDIHPFIKFGMMNNTEFYDKVKDCVIFKSSLGDSVSIPEYLERNKEKSENTVIYSTNKEQQATYISLCKDQGLEVIFLNAFIDTHFIQFLESKDSTIKYVSVDSSVSDHLVDKEKDSQIVDPADNKTENEKLETLFKTTLKNDALKIEVKSLKSDSLPAVVLQSEYSRRFKEMSAMMNRSAGVPAFDDFTLVINSSNPVVKNILKLNSELKTNDVELLCQYVYDLAMMSQKQLTGEQMQAFMARSNDVLKKLTEKL